MLTNADEYRVSVRSAAGSSWWRPFRSWNGYIALVTIDEYQLVVATDKSLDLVLKDAARLAGTSQVHNEARGKWFSLPF